MAVVVANAMEEVKTIIGAAVKKAALQGLLPDGPLPAFQVEVPADRQNGDFSANAAMVGAKAFRQPPRKIAESIATSADLSGTYFEKIDVAGPGFLNFYLSPHFYEDAVNTVLSEGKDYGRINQGHGRKTMVEFVSANPTGPMHMGNARGGSLGDCLASVLDFAGYDVTKEFYVNDAGNQIEKFGISLEARYLQHFKGEDAVPFPEDGYHGDDVKTRVEEYINSNGDKLLNTPEAERRQRLIDYALPKNVAALRSDLQQYRITYDNWFLESTLHTGAVDAAVNKLTEKGLTYEKDGALFYKNAEVLSKKLLAEGKTPEQIEKLGLKDDVLVRANGYPTYFAADIAYHYNKFAVRGFDWCIDVWGADHHGHVARLKGALDAIGLDGDKLDIVLMQLVRLTRGGEVVRMSKRTGKAITLSDLLDEIPLDAARFFFNLREPASHLEFDMDLAVKESSDNPVFYVQYAHARICSIIKNLAAEGIACDSAQLSSGLLKAPEEQELIRSLANFPIEIGEAARSLDPARITRYTVSLASAFHKFYNACRVKDEDVALRGARLTLCHAVKTVLENALGVLKITAPEMM